MANLISLEDHFIPEAVLTRPDLLEPFAFHLWPEALTSQLKSLHSTRLGDMAYGPISIQVVSAVPMTAPLSVCSASNLQLAAAVSASNGRLAGFAMLPMANPVEAVAELRQSVRDLGMRGAMIANHAEGTYYNGPEHEVFWAAAEQLDVPVYLHPTNAPVSHDSLYQDLPSPVAAMLSKGGWGWHADTAAHFIRLYACGVFDRHPRLKIVLGHAGEMLPYMLRRINGRLTKVLKVQRDFLEVFAQNVWITISGMWDLAPFACLQRAVAEDRIMFSVDYPFEKNETGRDFMEELRGSGMVSAAQWEMIAWRNAEKLLSLQRPDQM